MLSIIVAKSINNAIGKDNSLLWKLSADMKLFRSHTTDHCVIMGRKTFESMGKRALPNRINYVVTRQQDYQADGCTVTHSLEEAIKLAEETGDTETFIIGGEEIYRLSMEKVDKLYVTCVDVEKEGDAFFPEINFTKWVSVWKESYDKDEKNEYDFDFNVYERV